MFHAVTYTMRKKIMCWEYFACLVWLFYFTDPIRIFQFYLQVIASVFNQTINMKLKKLLPIIDSVI